MTAQVPIDAEMATFLAGGVAIVVATRDAEHRPHVVRGYSGRLSEDGKRLTVLVPVLLSAEILRDIDDNGQIAVVFSRVTDFRTYQIKGKVVEVGAPMSSADAAAQAYYDAFFLDLVRTGIPEDGVEGFRYSQLQPITFEPRIIYLQTPGPNAGRALEDPT